MIRSANHGSYPRLGDSPLDQQLWTIHRARERGRATDEEVARIEDEVSTVVVAEQARAFLDIVTDGMVRWDGPLSHLTRHLGGLARGELRRWFDTGFFDRRLVVVGPVVYREPFLVHDYQVAEGVSLRKPVKPVLPGPVTAARLARDEHYGAIEPLAEALAAALAAEVRALAAAGATCFQLDEPMLCRHPGDLDLVARTARVVFEGAGSSATTILSTYFGDLTALGPTIERLPGTHLGLDLTVDGGWETLAHLPEGRGVALGLFDARSAEQEDAADVARRLAPHRETLTQRDVIVGPNAGLELLPRDAAFDKLLHSRYLVEKLSKEWSWPS